MQPVENKPKPEVPNLPDWMYNYDGANGSHQDGRKLRTKHGEYYMSPVSDKNNRFVGYHLSFAHTGEGKPSKDGMWTDLGLFTHPGLAVGAARKHHRSFTKKESVEKRVANMLAKIESKKTPDDITLLRDKLMHLKNNA